jgi:hypothetical protein
MRSDKKHLTEITGSDLREIAMAANAYGGDGINVMPVGDRLEISIDLQFLQEVVLRILRGQSLI